MNDQARGARRNIIPVGPDTRRTVILGPLQARWTSLIILLNNSSKSTANRNGLREQTSTHLKQYSGCELYGLRLDQEIMGWRPSSVIAVRIPPKHPIANYIDLELRFHLYVRRGRDHQVLHEPQHGSHWT